MKTTLLLLAALSLASCASAPPTQDERAVIETVQGFFDCIESRDVAAGTRLTIPEGTFVSLRDVKGIPQVGHFSNATWLRDLPKETQPMRESFVGQPTVRIDGDVAVLMCRYEFTVAGKLSHTGVDAFTLLRTADGWQVAGGAYTVRR